MIYKEIFILISHILFTLSLGWYLITNLQWYNYKIDRVLFKHKRQTWHLFFFVIPIFAYYITGIYFWIYFYFALLPSYYVWQRKLDKKLVYTNRVKRFFLFLLLAVVFEDFLCLITHRCYIYGVILPLIAATIIGEIFERILFEGFKKEAKRKLHNMPELKIISVTASYGKTSIKNFLYQILKNSFKVYKTPKSINTEAGIIKDINTSLPDDTQIYIAEAGAREKGDIKKIVDILQNHYAIVGKIGPAHIEYFKTLENIRNTKMEIIEGKNIVKAYVHKSANISPNDKIRVFGDEIKEVNSSLNGLSFKIELNGKTEEFEAKNILGSFNAINITAAILMALEFGLDMDTIKKRVSKLSQVEHRLQKIELGGKLIIDDSYNGNLEGMILSYDLVSTYKGRKVLITPGIIESTKEANIELAKKIDKIFDIVIITGKANAVILMDYIKIPKKLLLSNKEKLQELLAKETKVGDLILFSNDAPAFI